MARAKRKLPAKPAAFISPHHRGHFCPVIRYPNTKPPPPTIHTPQKPTARSNGTDRRPNTKNPLPLRTPPAVFISSHHRGHFCCRHPIPEHKAPAADDNTHPTKTSRPGQTAPTDARTQKTRCRSEHRRPLSFLRTTAVTSAPSSDTRTQSPRRRQYTPHKNLTARSNGTDRCPNTKNPLPLRTPPAVSAFSKKTAALPKCHSSAPTTAGRRTTPPHTT